MKLIAFILSSVIFIQSMNIHISDIVNLGELINHAQFHQEEYGDDLFEFFAKHYGELKAEHEKQNPYEHQEHEKLPFHCDHHTSNHIQLIFSFVDKALIPTPKFFVFRESTSFYVSIYKSPDLNTILQPPRSI